MTVANSSKFTSELAGLVSDLPPQFRWDPRRLPKAVAVRRDSVHTMTVAALVLGIVSIPMAACLGGLLFGIAAVVLSVPGARGPERWGMAVTARVLGVIGGLLSIGVIVLFIVSSLAR